MGLLTRKTRPRYDLMFGGTLNLAQFNYILLSLSISARCVNRYMQHGIISAVKIANWQITG